MSQVFHIKGLGELSHGYTLVTDNIEVRINMKPTAERLETAHKHLQYMVWESMKPLMPHVSGNFIQGTEQENESMWGTDYIYAGKGPMGQYLYHGKVMVNAKTGKGPALIPGIGYRYKEGTTLKVTSRNLDTSNGSYGNWEPYWFDAAKRRDLKAWVRGVEKDLNG